jgi:hypothetical protein
MPAGSRAIVNDLEFNYFSVQRMQVSQQGVNRRPSRDVNYLAAQISIPWQLIPTR